MSTQKKLPVDSVIPENETSPAPAPELAPAPAPAEAKPNFDIFVNEGYITIKLTGKMDDFESSKKLESEIPNLINPPRNVIINCEHLSDLSPSWMRALVRLNHSLKTVNMQLRLIAVNQRLEQQLKSNGIHSSLRSCSSLRAALAEFGLVSPKTLDVNFINPFLDSTINVLKIQCTTEAKAGTPYKKAAGEKYSGDISGVIGLVSEAFSGSVVISFSEKTFLAIISRMLGETVTQISKEIEDGAGELTNIIFGQTKVLLNERGYGIKTAIPSVVTGANHSVLQMTRGPRVVIPFETDVGNFYVEICVADSV